MKLFGHPLHVMLIHFPSALFPMDFVCAAIAFYTGNILFAHASFFALAGGAVLGWCAVLAGLFDLQHVMERHPNAMKKALVHGGINTTVLIAYSVLAGVAFKKYPEISTGSAGLLITKALLVAVLIVGNYLGGNLILKEKIGVKE